MGSLALLTAGGWELKRRIQTKIIPGRIIGASSHFGHLVRQSRTSAPQTQEELDVVIVGGGISGLSSAWWLKKQGLENFAVLELESHVGGNSQYGQNEISAYPWGAHYLPLPSQESTYVRSLLEELDVIQGYNEKGLPIYNEFYLCADPHERLLIEGNWQEGLVPQTGLTASDRKDYQEFFKLMEFYKKAKGRDGKVAFSIPLDMSSQDTDLLALDRISMKKFMDDQRWSSSKLRWYVNYCCRDDYGRGYEHVSAWAGIHYFASRVGVGANADSQTILTWPEGNGWLVKKLQEKLVDKLRPESLAVEVKNHGDRVFVDYYHQTELKRVVAKKAIFAAPRFVAAHVMPELKAQAPTYLRKLQYAPWMVGNVSLKSRPRSTGAALSWDNVSYYSRSLGYVVSTHQGLSLYPQETVLTYYLPLDQQDPSTARKEALKKSHSDWAKLIADDLEKMHPGIGQQIKSIDVWVWGHGMISPGIDYLWSADRKELLRSCGKIEFAHSDMSGVSIFEEAQYRGVQAAKKVLSDLNAGSFS